MIRPSDEEKRRVQEEMQRILRDQSCEKRGGRCHCNWRGCYYDHPFRVLSRFQSKQQESGNNA